MKEDLPDVVDFPKPRSEIATSPLCISKALAYTFPSNYPTKFKQRVGRHSTEMSQTPTKGTSQTARPNAPPPSDWNSLLRHSSPLGIVKPDIITNVYNTPSSRMYGHTPNPNPLTFAGTSSPYKWRC